MSDANIGRPLEGTKVLDLTRVLAGPFCSMILADLGADVVKVEPPNGDETRRWGPPFHRGTAAYYFGANRNKWGIVLDLTTEPDRSTLRSFLRQADVVIQNFTGATARKLGVDYHSVFALNPRVIHLSLWALGPEDPETRGFDLTSQASAGMMAVTGATGGGPVKVGTPISDIAASLYSAVAIASELVARAQTGRGARLDVSLQDSALALLPSQSMSWLLCGYETPRLGSDHPTITPYGSYDTSDRSIVIAVGTDEQFRKLCRALAAPALADDPRFLTNADRVEHRIELREVIESATRQRPASEWRAIFDATGVPSAIVRSVGEALSAPDTRSLSEIDHPKWGRVKQVMNPIRIDGEYLAPYKAPPSLDEDGEIVIGKSMPE